MSEFCEIRQRIERMFEDAIIEVVNITTPEGIRIMVEDRYVIAAVRDLMDSAEKAYLSNKTILVHVPGAER